MAAPPDNRRHIIELLQPLASEELQLVYERTVPIADVPAELLCKWFDDLYYPGIESQFEPGEAEALSRFNVFYAKRELLPELWNDPCLAGRSDMAENHGGRQRNPETA
jgi:hypothetical protein